MPPVALRGLTLDEREQGLAGLRVVVRAATPHEAGARLGEAVTDEAGCFSLTVHADPVDGRFRLHVYDPHGIRQVHQTDPLPLSLDGRDAWLPPVRIPRDDVRGWRVPADAAPTLAGNRVDVLVDGCDAFERMVDAIRDARDHVHLMQLYLEPGFTACYPDDAPPVRLVDELAAAGARGARVRVLLNENAVLHDDGGRLRHHFFARRAPNVHVRGLLMTPNVLHAKVLVVDHRDAFLIGSPFQQRFWDTRDHRARDARRDTPRPTHDLSVHLRGPGLQPLAEDFARFWNLAQPGEDPVSVPPAPPEAGSQTAQIVRTWPRKLLSERPEGSRGILESYERAFAEAKEFVYLENQYYTSGTINQLVDRALRAKPRLQVIMLLNHAVDVPGYIRWQKRRLQELGYPDRERFGAFTLWRPSEREDGGLTLHRCYVHSKVGIVDDRWASLGTANLDSISLEESTDFGVPFPRNVEVNCLLFDGVDGAPATGIARRLRTSLWSEFLGCPEEAVATRPPEGGWLPWWQARAEENLARLRAGDVPDGVVVLPYHPDGPRVEGARVA